MFAFSTRLALYKVDFSFFPLVYVGLLLVGMVYKCSTRIVMADNALIRKGEIRLHYLKFEFWTDIIVIVLSFLEYFRVSSGIFRLCIFLKLFYAKHIVDKFEAFVLGSRFGSKQATMVWRIMSLIALNCIIAHCVVLIVVCICNDDVTPSWMASIGIRRDQANWGAAYAWSFYWAVTIMTTIGFGDITVSSPR